MPYKITPRIEKALLFAFNAHHGQLRKYTNEPYITHPLAVAEIVSSVAHDENMIIAALLHDVVEDCGVNIFDVCEKFGTDVSQLVFGLTDASKKSDGNREARKKIDRKHIKKMCDRTKTIKLADLIHNSSSIELYAPKFAVTYMAEKRLLLDEALIEGDSELWDRADKIVGEYYEKQR